MAEHYDARTALAIFGGAEDATERGTHAQLIAKRGAYYRYYSLGFQQAVAGPATAQMPTNVS